MFSSYKYTIFFKFEKDDLQSFWRCLKKFRLEKIHSFISFNGSSIKIDDETYFDIERC
jgi:hypothetical protein